MAGITPQGFVNIDFQDIVDQIAATQKGLEGDEYPTTPDSAFGQIANTFAEPIKDLWDLAETATAQLSKDTAAGVYLGYLAGNRNMEYLQAAGSVGYLAFTGLKGAIVPAGFPCRDTLQRSVVTTEEGLLDNSKCYSTGFAVNALEIESEYTITVDGIPFTYYTSEAPPTEDDILTGLADVLESADTVDTRRDGNTLIVFNDSQGSTLNIISSDNMSLIEVSVLLSAVSVDLGALDFPADTVKYLASSLPDVDSVNNPYAFVEGRDTETEEELRARMSAIVQSSALGTKAAIEAAVLASVDGVTAAYIVANTDITRVGNIDGKSFETFVQGGADGDIAQVIWQAKSVTSKTSGDISVIIQDENGDDVSVRFSRRAEKFASLSIKVAYDENESDLAASWITELKGTVADYGNTLAVGADFDSTRFYQPIYQAVPKGIRVLSIEVAVTNLPTDPPQFVTTPIAVSPAEYLVFKDTRVRLEVV